MARVQDAREIHLTPRANAPGEARAFAERVAAGYDLESRSNLALVVSELVTRSVMAGADGPIVLRIAPAGSGLLRGDVRGPGTTVLDGLDNSHEGIVSARIVDHLTQAWGVDADAGTAWFEVRVAADD